MVKLRKTKQPLHPDNLHLLIDVLSTKGTDLKFPKSIHIGPLTFSAFAQLLTCHTKPIEGSAVSVPLITRGTLRRILPQALEKMTELYQRLAPDGNTDAQAAFLKNAFVVVVNQSGIQHIPWALVNEGAVAGRSRKVVVNSWRPLVPDSMVRGQSSSSSSSSVNAILNRKQQAASPQGPLRNKWQDVSTL
jgi:hypothetical protein